jgi:hypothetical protein
VGYKVIANSGGKTDIDNAYLIADSCPPVGSPDRP